MNFIVSISLFDHEDGQKIISFFKRRKFVITNLLENEEIYDPIKGEYENKYSCVNGTLTDNFSLGSALVLELYKYSATDASKVIDKIISDLKASSFPYFTAFAYHIDGYWAVDHGHLISKANNHVEVKKVTEIVEVIKEVVKEKEVIKESAEDIKKTVKKLIKKTPRKTKSVPKSAVF